MGLLLFQDTKVLSGGVSFTVNVVAADRFGFSLPDELQQQALIIVAA